MFDQDAPTTRRMTHCSPGRNAGVLNDVPDPISDPVTLVVNLAHLYKEGYQYSSINSY